MFVSGLLKRCHKPLCLWAACFMSWCSVGMMLCVFNGHAEAVSQNCIWNNALTEDFASRQAGHMAQSIKRLLHQQDDLGWDPENPVKRQVCYGIFNLRAGSWRGSDCCSLTRQPSLLGSKPVRDLELREMPEIDFWLPQTLACRYTWMYHT